MPLPAQLVLCPHATIPVKHLDGTPELGFASEPPLRNDRIESARRGREESLIDGQTSAARRPHVSVVIPTHQRPGLLRRAVDSVLAQTFPDFELIVVVDGPDPETEEMLAAEQDRRLRIHVNSAARGGGGARNEGIRLATGQLVALLDDDDVWLPDKLALQLASLPSTESVSFTRLIARAPHGDYIWPRRGPEPEEHISEYLFVRRSLFAGEAGIQTSTILAPTELFRRQPFDESLARLQDTDWLLRVCSAGTALSFCPRPLTVWHVEEDRASITTARHRDWRLLYDWIGARRGLVTPRAYAAFLLVRGATATSAAHDLRGTWKVLREAFRRGQPAPLDIFLFVTRWLAPASMRQRLRARFSAGKYRSGNRWRRRKPTHPSPVGAAADPRDEASPR